MQIAQKVLATRANTSLSGLLDQDSTSQIDPIVVSEPEAFQSVQMYSSKNNAQEEAIQEEEILTPEMKRQGFKRSWCTLEREGPSYGVNFGRGHGSERPAKRLQYDSQRRPTTSSDSGAGPGSDSASKRNTYFESDSDSSSDSSSDEYSESNSNEDPEEPDTTQPQPGRLIKYPVKATYGGLNSHRWRPVSGNWKKYRKDQDSKRGWYGLESSYDDDFKVEGIQILFKTKGAAPSFLQLEIERVTTDLMEAAKDPILFQRVTYKGRLVVVVGTTEAAARLLRVREVAGYEVASKALSSDNANNLGRIFNVPLGCTNEELQECFVSQGVIRAWRQMAYKRQTGLISRNSPSVSVILTFRPDRPMPESVVPKGNAVQVLGEEPFMVTPFYSPPIRCKRCQRFGHTQAYCERSRRCKNCAGPHDYKECDRLGRPKCANCKGPHPASYTKCPFRRLEAAEKQFLQAETLARNEALSSEGK